MDKIQHDSLVDEIIKKLETYAFDVVTELRNVSFRTNKILYDISKRIGTNRLLYEKFRKITLKLEDVDYFFS